MYCEYLGQSGFWGTKQCRAGETINVDHETLKTFCMSSENHINCPRYKQKKEAEAPQTDYKEILNESINTVKEEMKLLRGEITRFNALSLKGTFYIGVMTVLLTLLISIIYDRVKGILILDSFEMCLVSVPILVILIFVIIIKVENMNKVRLSGLTAIRIIGTIPDVSLEDIEDNLDSFIKSKFKFRSVRSSPKFGNKRKITYTKHPKGFFKFLKNKHWIMIELKPIDSGVEIIHIGCFLDDSNKEEKVLDIIYSRLDESFTSCDISFLR